MISADRTTVTFIPDAGLESIKHPFWKPTKHDGTRIYIYGSDLSSLKTGLYSIKGKDTNQCKMMYVRHENTVFFNINAEDNVLKLNGAEV